MSGHTLNSKFAVAALLGSTLMLSGCGNDNTEICASRDRVAYTSNEDPTYVELRPRVMTDPRIAVAANRPVFSARGIYSEEEVREIALDYCLRNELP